MDHKIFVTGIGFITSIGNDRITVTDSLRKLVSGIENHPELQVESSPVKVAGTVKEFDLESTDPEDWTYPAAYQVPRTLIRSFSPHVLYAWSAVRQAIEDAGLSQEDLSNPDSGLYTASGGSMRSIHKHFQKMDDLGVMACNPLAIIASIAGTLSFNLVAALGSARFLCRFGFRLCFFRSCPWHRIRRDSARTPETDACGGSGRL